MHVVSGKGKMKAVVFGSAMRAGQRQMRDGVCFEL
jgi:hypothetical protein